MEVMEEDVSANELTDTIKWRIHLKATPERVFDTLASDEGRALFWAADARESDGTISFKFSNGMVLDSKVLERQRPARFALEYFGGSRVQFDLTDDGKGGTDLTMTESGIPEGNLLEHLPGWISVLLSLKAAVDFSIDLRNNDPQRTWDQGYVDV